LSPGIESSVDRTIATSSDTEVMLSAGVAVWEPSLCSASATPSHPSGDAKAPCTSTIVGFDSAARAGVEKAESDSIKAAEMSAPSRRRRPLRATATLWVRPFMTLLLEGCSRAGGVYFPGHGDGADGDCLAGRRADQGCARPMPTRGAAMPMPLPNT